MAKNIYISIVLPVTMGVIIIICLKLFWVIYLSDVPEIIKNPVKIVIKSCYLSRISSDYWENDFEEQADVIARTKQDERVAFFKKIVISSCELDTSRASTFVEKLGKDADALRNSLIELRKSQEFNTLSEEVKAVVIDWIDGLEVVVNQQNEVRK